MNIDKVFIIGAGLMGSGIAQACAQSGIEVILNDINRKAVDNALKNIEWSVSKFVEKGKLPETKKNILGRIKTASDMSQVAEAALIIEAAFENFKVKQGRYSGN